MRTSSRTIRMKALIVNLSGQILTPEQTEVLILGLRDGLATRPNSLEMMGVSEDIYDQLDKKNISKECLFMKDKVKYSIIYTLLIVKKFASSLT